MARRVLISEPQLAAWWNTSRTHLRRLRAEHGLPFIRLGKLVRYDPDQVAGWVELHTGQRPEPWRDELLDEHGRPMAPVDLDAAIARLLERAAAERRSAAR